MVKMLIFWRRHFEGVTFRRHFSHSKAAEYLMHSTGGCATSRRVSIIQARAFFAVRGSDVLFRDDFVVCVCVLVILFIIYCIIWKLLNVVFIMLLLQCSWPPGPSASNKFDLIWFDLTCFILEMSSDCVVFRGSRLLPDRVVPRAMSSLEWRHCRTILTGVTSYWWSVRSSAGWSWDAASRETSGTSAVRRTSSTSWTWPAPGARRATSASPTRRSSAPNHVPRTSLLTSKRPIAAFPVRVSSCNADFAGWFD